jgi:hypothetical protein
VGGNITENKLRFSQTMSEDLLKKVFRTGICNAVYDWDLELIKA